MRCCSLNGHQYKWILKKYKKTKTETEKQLYTPLSHWVEFKCDDAFMIKSYIDVARLSGQMGEEKKYRRAYREWWRSGVTQLFTT